MHDRHTGLETQHAGTLVGLYLQQFHQPRLLARRGHHAQLAALVGEHQAHLVDRQQLDALTGEPMEEFDHIKVVDKRIGEFDERLCQALCTHSYHLA